MFGLATKFGTRECERGGEGREGDKGREKEGNKGRERAGK